MREPTAGRPVFVATVYAEFITVTGRVAYRVTLTCGCYFWELRDPTAPVPETDTAALCFADHTAAVAHEPLHG
jgi:hypothetical protein